MAITYKVIDVLRAACSAFRMTGGYTNVRKYDMGQVVKQTMGIEGYDVPTCNISEADIKQADEIKDYMIRHLTFTILSREAKKDDDVHQFSLLDEENNERYEKRLYDVLQSEEIILQKFKTLTDLPEYYIKYRAFKEIKKGMAGDIDNSPLGKVNNVVFQKECDVFHVMKTKNYDGYNVTGIIDNKLVSWYSTSNMPVGIYVIARATVKEFSHNFYANCMNTRLTSVSLRP